MHCCQVCTGISVIPNCQTIMTMTGNFKAHFVFHILFITINVVSQLSVSEVLVERSDIVIAGNELMRVMRHIYYELWIIC